MSAAPEPSQPPRRVGAVLWRMLRSVDLRCPHCRQGRLYHHVYLMHERCPVCGLAYQRDEGDFWGGVVFTYTYAGILGLAAVGVLFKLGVEPWETIAYLGAGAAVLAVLAVFPFAKAQWIALLYATRGHYAEYRPPEGG